MLYHKKDYSKGCPTSIQTASRTDQYVVINCIIDQMYCIIDIFDTLYHNKGYSKGCPSIEAGSYVALLTNHRNWRQGSPTTITVHGFQCGHTLTQIHKYTIAQIQKYQMNQPKYLRLNAALPMPKPAFQNHGRAQALSSLTNVYIDQRLIPNRHFQRDD